MNLNQIYYDRIPCEEITLNTNEAAARLRTERGYTSPEIEECLGKIMKEADCRYACIRVPVKRGENYEIDLGFGKFRSEKLSKNLTGCDEAFVFAVTVGIGIDRLLQRLSLTSPALHFTCDALASALAESLCDKVDGIIRGELQCRPRFSPGYGDLPLEIQPGILNMLNAGRLLGITIGKQLLMTPTKSITAIMGIEK